MKRYILFTLLLFTYYAAVAQVKGTVSTETGDRLPYVNVVAYSLPDSTMVEGVLTDIQGNFSLAEKCDYIVLSFIGYKTETINNFNNDNINVTLHQSDINLKEVQVTAQAPLVVERPDRKIVQVANSTLALTEDGLDMLQKVPGLMPKGINGVEVMGAGTPLIYIDNRTATIDEVRNLRPEMIKSVEVIDNPSSRYSATANSVVIINTLRRNDYYNVNLYGSVKRSRVWTELASATATLSGKKLMARLSYSGNDSRTNELQEMSYGINKNVIDNQDNLYHNRFHNGSAFLEYRINNNHTIGVQEYVTYMRANNTEFHSYSTHGDDGLYDFYTPQASKKNSLSSRTSVYYNAQLDTLGQQLDVTFNYYRNKHNEIDTFRNVLSDTVPYNIYPLNTSQTDGLNNVYAATLDYNKPFKNNLSVQAGAKWSLMSSDANTDQYLREIDTIRQSYMNKENTAALYASLSWSDRKKWYLRGGVRAEGTWREYLFTNIDGVGKTTYYNIYPELTVSYTPAKKYKLSLTYREYVTKPSLKKLDPTHNIDTLEVNYGDATLLNSIVHSFGFSTTFPHNISFNVRYRYEKDPIDNVTYARPDEPNMLYNIPMNMDKSQFLMAKLGWYYKPVKWFNVRLTAAYMQFFVKAELDEFPDEVFVNNKPSFMGAVSLNFAMPWSMNLMVSYQYDSPGADGWYYDLPRHNLYASLSQSFLDRALTLRLSGSNLLGLGNFRQYSIFPGGTYTYYDGDERSVHFSVSYNFGKLRKTVYDRNISSEESDRL